MSADGDKPVVPVTHTAEHATSWAAWSADRTELRQVFAELDRMAKQRSGAVVGAMEKELATVAPEGWRHERLTDRIGAAKAELAARLQVKTNKGQTITGPLDDVISRVDHRTWVELNMFMGGQYNPITGREWIRIYVVRGESPAVWLQVQSKDSDWATLAFNHLRDRIDLSKPRWAWAHEPNGYGLVGAAMSVAVMWVVLVVGNFVIGGYGQQLGSTLLIGAIALAAGVTFSKLATRRILYSALPPSEIRQDGELVPKGTKLLLGTLMAIVIPGLFLVLQVLIPLFQ